MTLNIKGSGHALTLMSSDGALTFQTAPRSDARATRVFKQQLEGAIGDKRAERIYKRYQISLTGSSLTTRTIAKIMTGIRDVQVEDMEAFIELAKSDQPWPKFAPLELREILKNVQNSESLSAELFSYVRDILATPFTTSHEVPGIVGKISGGPTEKTMSYSPFLADRERLTLCESLPNDSFEVFVQDMAIRVIKREPEVGMLISAPRRSDGASQFYRVAAKLITGKGMVSYIFVPATKDADLQPIRFFRGTSVRSSEVDSAGAMLTDLEPELGHTAFQSGVAYEAEFEKARDLLPPVRIVAGHSLGSTLAQKQMVRDPNVLLGYFFNGPGITEREVNAFNTNAAASPDERRGIVVREVIGDNFSTLGEMHLGFNAPDHVELDYCSCKLHPSVSANRHVVVPGKANSTNQPNSPFREGKEFAILPYKPMDLNRRVQRRHLGKRNALTELVRTTAGPLLRGYLEAVVGFTRTFLGSRTWEQRGLQVGGFDATGRWVTRIHR